jgi:hypothetical protein
MPQEQPPAARCSAVAGPAGPIAGVTFLAYFLLGPGQEPELSFPAG